MGIGILDGQARGRSGGLSLLSGMMSEISDLIRETRIESLFEPGRPRAPLAAHRRIADAIRCRAASEAAAARYDHVQVVSEVALLRPYMKGISRLAAPYTTNPSRNATTVNPMTWRIFNFAMASTGRSQNG